jgi:hypothetical protein
MKVLWIVNFFSSGIKTGIYPQLEGTEGISTG